MDFFVILITLNVLDCLLIVAGQFSQDRSFSPFEENNNVSYPLLISCSAPSMYLFILVNKRCYNSVFASVLDIFIQLLWPKVEAKMAEPFQSRQDRVPGRQKASLCLPDS